MHTMRRVYGLIPCGLSEIDWGTVICGGIRSITGCFFPPAPGPWCAPAVRSRGKPMATHTGSWRVRGPSPFCHSICDDSQLIMSSDHKLIHFSLLDIYRCTLDAGKSQKVPRNISLEILPESSRGLESVPIL